MLKIYGKQLRLEIKKHRSSPATFTTRMNLEVCSSLSCDGSPSVNPAGNITQHFTFIGLQAAVLIYQGITAFSISEPEDNFRYRFQDCIKKPLVTRICRHLPQNARR